MMGVQPDDTIITVKVGPTCSIAGSNQNIGPTLG